MPRAAPGAQAAGAHLDHAKSSSISGTGAHDPSLLEDLLVAMRLATKEDRIAEGSYRA
jgi:hypothetical protein